MSIFPIVPIWLMIIICGALLFFVIKNKKNRIIRISIVVLLFIINLRIMIPSANSKVLANNLDVLFVVDSTLSMNAEDYNGKTPRLEAVKEDCKYIVEKLGGARFSVISFNNDAKLLTPFTKDANITTETINIIHPIEELYAKGSSLNKPIETILSALKTSEKNNDKIRLIFFITDGEITDDSKIEGYNEVAKHINNGAVLGYGTTKGGYIKEKDYYTGKEEYITDFSYGDKNNDYRVVSVIDENNLRKLASDMNIDYIHMDKQSNVDKKLNQVLKLARDGVESSDKSTYDDLYFIFVIPLLVLLMIDFNLVRGKKI